MNIEAGFLGRLKVRASADWKSACFAAKALPGPGGTWNRSPTSDRIPERRRRPHLPTHLRHLDDTRRCQTL